MRKRVRVGASGLLAAGAAALLGGILAASTAFAYPAAPTNIVIHSDADVADNYLNANEVNSVTVTGDTPSIPAGEPGPIVIRVQIVNSASCDPNAPQQTQELFASLTGLSGETWEAIFTDTNSTDAFGRGQPVSTFSEGAVLCARARASSDGKASDDITKVYGPAGKSATLPVKDTVVSAGTVVINDPRDDGFLNYEEAVVDLAVRVTGDFTAADADATKARAWWGPVGLGTYDAGACGDPAGAFTTPPTGTKVLTVACAAFISEGDTFSLNAQWEDAAGNESTIAFAQAPLSRPLVKDTLAPVRAKVQMFLADNDMTTGANTISSANVENVLVRVTTPANPPALGEEFGVTIDLDLTDDVDGNPLIDTVNTTHLRQRKLSTDPNPINFVFDASSLKDSDDADVAPGGGLAGKRPDHTLPELIQALATVTDPAGNVDDGPGGFIAEATFTDAPGTGYDDADGLDDNFKDATLPETPVLTVVPGNIQTDVSTIVEVELTGLADCSVDCDKGVPGRDYQTVSLTLSDEDPGTGDVTNSYNTFQGDPAVFVDTAPLTDGIITVTATLTDGLGNVSGLGTTTATKGLTTPSVVITAPAANSLNNEYVKFAGTALANSQVTVFDAGNDEPIVTNVPVDSSGVWKVTGTDGRGYRYLSSGTKRIYARRIGDTARGSAVRSFIVDAIKPTAQIDTMNASIYTPGQEIVIKGSARDDSAGGLPGFGVAAVRIDVYDARNTRPEVNPADPTHPIIRYGLPDPADLAATCAACATFQRSVLWSYDLTGALAKGEYVVQATPIDRAGNRAAQPEQITIVVL